MFAKYAKLVSHNRKQYYRPMDTTKSLWTIFLILVGAFIAYLLYEVLLILFLAFLLTLALHPSVEWLKKKGIPRTLSVLTMVSLFVGGLAAAVFFIGPELVSQVRALVQQAPEHLKRIEEAVGIEVNNDFIMNQISSFTGEAGNLLYSLTSSVILVITSVVLVVVLAIYWLIYYDQIKQLALKGVPKRHKKAARTIVANVERNMKAWVIGQGSLCLLVGALAGIAYFVVGLPFALPLAVFAAIMEIVPNLGPTLAVIPAIIVALTISPVTAIITLGAYLVIQVVESYFLNPKIMSRVTRLNPFIVILAIIVGTHLFGLIGTLIAVPLLLLGKSVIEGVHSANKSTHATKS